MTQMDQSSRKQKRFSPAHTRQRLNSLLELKEYFEGERQNLRDELAIADRQVEAVEFLIESITENDQVAHVSDEITEEPVVESPGSNSIEEDQSWDSGPVSGVATVADIAHCITQREAAYVIAKLNGGVVDLNTAAVMIKAAGLSKGMVSTVLSSLHHFMTHAPQWVYVGPSTFEIVEDRDDVSEPIEEPDFSSENAGASRAGNDDFRVINEMSETAA